MSKKRSNLEENTFDIISFLKKIWAGKKLIIQFSLMFFLIGCIVAILSPVEYTSQTTFVPQVSEEELSSKSGLGSLASLAGINLNSNSSGSDSYLSPLLYSKIVDSEEFSYALINQELIDISGKKFSVKDYMMSQESNFNFDIIGTLKRFITNLFNQNDHLTIEKNIIKDYNFINEEDFKLLKSFRSKFRIELNEMDGYIRVIASDNNAFISSQLVNHITKNLQTKIIEIRTNKIRERLEFSKEQYELKQIEFDLLQKKLAEFQDSNKNISTASFRAELQKLETEYQLQKNILMNLAGEYNNNKIKLNKDTPIFSVIDNVTIPNERSKPKRTLISISFLVLGVILSSGYVAYGDYFREIINELKK